MVSLKQEAATRTAARVSWFVNVQQVNSFDIKCLSKEIQSTNKLAMYTRDYSSAWSKCSCHQ